MSATKTRENRGLAGNDGLLTGHLDCVLGETLEFVASSAFRRRSRRV